MRVLILSQYYDPEPVPKPVELAQELQRHGHEVSVITGFPNYPSGTLYPGFKLRPIQHTQVDGVPVTRTFEYPYHGKHALGRMLNFASFMFSAPFGLLTTGPCDVIYVWHPPLTIGVAAWIMARLRRVPFVYDVQDIWPESAVLSGVLRDGLLVRLLTQLEKFVYRRADHLLVVTGGARDNLIAKGVPPDQVSVMPHWIDEILFGVVDDASALSTRHRMDFNDHFVVLFAGNLGLVQGLDTVIYAADLLRHDDKILMVLVGDGTDKSRLQSLVDSLNLQHRVRFIDRQPMESMPAIMAASDVLLVHLKRSELSKYTIPSKTMAYLAAGKPILMAAEGAAADLIIQAGAGMTISPDNPSALAEGIRQLRACSKEERVAMGYRGRQYLLSHHAKAVVIPLYEDLLQETALAKRKQP